MARYETIVCDECRKRARRPAIGWIRTVTPSGVFVDPADVVPGDWCGTACLLAHFGDVVLQEPLDGLDEDAQVGESVEETTARYVGAGAPRQLHGTSTP